AGPWSAPASIWRRNKPTRAESTFAPTFTHSAHPLLSAHRASPAAAPIRDCRGVRVAQGRKKTCHGSVQAEAVRPLPAPQTDDPLALTVVVGAGVVALGVFRTILLRDPEHAAS